MSKVIFEEPSREEWQALLKFNRWRKAQRPDDIEPDDNDPDDPPPGKSQPPQHKAA